ncbi:MAG: hypothetical protein PVI26_01215 [Chitinispirillia bacterium]|jgi:hypothetical protein
MDFDLNKLPLAVLYAETHFRFFRFFPSFLYQKEPEIIFDMPKRIDSGNDVPVILICNDTDSYPIKILNVSLSLSQNSGSKKIFCESDISKYKIDHPFKNQSEVYLFSLSKELFTHGAFAVNGKAVVLCKKKERIIFNDNLKTTSKAPLVGYFAENRLPGYEYCLYGDLHVHSQFSRSHVEFGPPVSIIDTVASACGLSFVGITDHSYDLSCEMDNYLKTDPELGLWKSFVNNIQSQKKMFKTVIIPGEEISVCNENGHVVHLCTLGIKDFIPGSKDGARRQKGIPDTLKLEDVIKTIQRENGYSFAAHPGAKSSLLQRLFLKRGKWGKNDVHRDLQGFQPLNGGFTLSWRRAQQLWRSMLLKGYRLPLVAGNDAHGDFNRYRAIDKPFINIKENFFRHFSYSRTGIYCMDRSEEQILKSLKEGKTFITNGPYIGLSITDNPRDSIIKNRSVEFTDNTFYVIVYSTPEFGRIAVVQVIRGYYSSKCEKLLFNSSLSDQSYYLIKKIVIDPEHGLGYIRASVQCLKNDNTRAMAFTSPCYINK